MFALRKDVASCKLSLSTPWRIAQVPRVASSLLCRLSPCATEAFRRAGAAPGDSHAGAAPGDSHAVYANGGARLDASNSLNHE